MTTEPAASPPPEPASLRAGPLAATAAFLALAAGALVVATRAVTVERTPPPPVHGEVPPFSFQDAKGATVTRETLRGRIWVADFIFTACAGICPEMSIRMARVQEEVRGHPDTLLVSFTVDPERDTPAVLREYAAAYGAAEGRWLFLRGTQEAAVRLQYEGFRMGDAKDPFLHSQRLALVDRAGRIRGWYAGIGEEGVRDLLRDWKAIRDEGTP